jgi:hypothetical protein
MTVHPLETNPSGSISAVGFPQHSLKGPSHHLGAAKIGMIFNTKTVKAYMLGLFPTKCSDDFIGCGKMINPRDKAVIQ